MAGLKAIGVGRRSGLNFVCRQMDFMLTDIKRTHGHLMVFAWICVIFFTSTGQAGRWAEDFFALLWRTVLIHLNPDGSLYPVVHFGFEKSVHITVFAVLAMLMWDVVPRRCQNIGFFLLIGLAVGTCSELAQRLSPNRDPALRDVLINTVATGVGATISLIMARIHGTGVTAVPTVEISQ